MHQICAEIFEGLLLILLTIKVDISNTDVWRKILLNMINDEGPKTSNQVGEWS